VREVALEDGVLLHHRAVLFRHERLENGGGDVGVVVGTKGVADVVEQGADDVLLVLAGDSSIPVNATRVPSGSRRLCRGDTPRPPGPDSIPCSFRA
jgi:hypothetical protein